MRRALALAAWTVVIGVTMATVAASRTAAAGPADVTGAGATQAVVDRIAAIVGDQVITLSDVRAAADLELVDGAAAMTQPQLTERLIERELMRAEVERFGAAEVMQDAVDARVQRIRSRYSSDAAFKAALDAHGLSDARFRAWLVDDARIDAYVQQRFAAAAQPTDEEVLQYYLSREREFAGEDGRPRPFADVQDTVRQRLSESRRRAMIEDWLTGLRRRTTVVVKDQESGPR